MSVSLNSVGHFFAKFLHGVLAVEQKAAKSLTELAATETTVEAVTTSVGASAVVPVEKAAYAVLGEVAQVLTLAGEAGEAKLADAGLDSAVIEKVKSILADSSQVVALAKAL